MSFESPNEATPSLEKLKDVYKEKLDTILSIELTVENIDTFANDALNELVNLTDEILNQYKTNEALEANLSLNKRDQENDAFQKLGLIDIGEILQNVLEVKSNIEILKGYIIHHTQEVITPSQSTLREGLHTGSGEGIEDKKLVPRLLTLLYILEKDFKIAKENVQITQGSVTPDMMRRNPYVRVEVSDLGRVVYICDEEGNATYVFDSQKLKNLDISFENLDIEDKGTLNDLISKYPGIGLRIIQTKHWRTNISNILSNSILESSEAAQDIREKPISEFIRREKKEFLPFHSFQTEVRVLYPGEGGVEDWYSQERSKHPNWCSDPSAYYKDKGWKSWPELVGKEKLLLKDFLSFETFQTEVRALYPGERNIQDWYKKERPKHKNWSSKPYEHYNNEGWIGWPELVGKENPLKREFPPFSDFQGEVRSLYSGDENIHGWYNKERLKYPNWHSAPYMYYKDKGWKSWPELVGKEARFKKEVLPFTDFQTEVRALYSGKGVVSEWYAKEGQRHLNWPSRPQVFYKDKGWVGWSELVGKENHLKKEFISFANFQTEVRSLYPEGKAVQKWYKNERPKHKDWPYVPNAYYKDEGWLGWPELVGKENPLKKEILSFETFQLEVRASYSGGNIQYWYKNERPKHSNWHSDPAWYYKNRGWIGWPELVGKENFLKKEFLSFETFQSEVRALYPGEGQVSEWYKNERPKHSNWHSHPSGYYKNRGWIGWPELVGKENFLKKEFLSFEALQEEVRALYSGKGSIAEWYNRERQNHSNWHSTPYEYYKDKGWKSWSEFIDPENLRKKVFLSFETFQVEVESLYTGAGGVVEWYQKERQKHSNWPSNPQVYYKDRGWKGWPELAGKGK